MPITSATTLLNPTVIVEVLSPSTRDYDRGTKFQQYRPLPSLVEYLTVEQAEARIEHHIRQPENRWLLTESTGLTATLRLESIGCTLTVAEIYDKIDCAEAAS